MRPFPIWIPEKWFKKIVVEPGPHGLDDPCWLWQGAHTPDGYPVARDPETGKVIYLHRRSWEKHIGAKLGSDHDGHHLCEQRNCIQPTHIEGQKNTINRGNTSAIKFSKEILSATDLASLADTYWIRSVSNAIY